LVRPSIQRRERGEKSKKPHMDQKTALPPGVGRGQANGAQFKAGGYARLSLTSGISGGRVRARDDGVPNDWIKH
jgi:hypothetical protein